MFESKKRSNKESAKAARATRGDHTTHVPRCSVGLHGSFLRLRKRTTFDDNFARKARWRTRKWTSEAARASPKTIKNRPNFALGRSRALWGARDRSGDGAGTCWGRLWGANKPPRDRSWVARSGPRACGKRPKAFPGRSRDAPGRPRSSA